MNLFEVVNLNRAPKCLTGLDEIHVNRVNLVGVVFSLTLENKHFGVVVRSINNRTIRRGRAADIAGRDGFNFIQASQFSFELRTLSRREIFA